MKLGKTAWPYLGLAGALWVMVMAGAAYPGPKLTVSPESSSGSQQNSGGGAFSSSQSVISASLRESEVADIQARLLIGLRKAQQAVVAVRHTQIPSAASGVIISPDGIVLSQWHVKQEKAEVKRQGKSI